MNEANSYSKLFIILATTIASVMGSGEIIDLRAAQRSEEISKQNHAILEEVIKNQGLYIQKYEELLSEIEKMCPALNSKLNNRR
jgi:hypothetical protein